MIKPTPAPENLRRAVILILDGAGVGSLPDAQCYGDAGANTLGHVLSQHGPLNLPLLFALGLGEILNCPACDLPRGNCGAWGRAAFLNPGKDTTSGHWELAGLILDKPFPTYPQGFPQPLIQGFEEAIGRGVLGNCAASGTEIISRLGEEHLATGRPIVYTSGDSVFQIAVHETVAPTEKLYHWCRLARSILQGEHAVGRVIARPFTGSKGKFWRTAGRKDFSLSPPGRTLLDTVAAAGLTTAVVGKIADIFNYRGITQSLPGGDNDAVLDSLAELLIKVKAGLLWANCGDFDTLYGHRNDAPGFARALERVDRRLQLLKKMVRFDDLVIITADHGCDPTYPGTDHTREYAPLLVWSPSLPGRIALGTRPTLADAGATAAAWLGLPSLENGTSFLDCFPGA